MTKIKFKYRYDIGKNEEFWTEPDKTEVTDQSQLCQASIVEMAKKFGIEAIIAKAEQTSATPELQDKLYGHDFTKLFTSQEERLNVKRKLVNIFENIPARIRKEFFDDNIGNFIDAYTTNDETKLSELNKIGLVSDTQINEVRELNKQRKAEKQENEIRKQFIEKLENEKGALYETYKTTGNIVFNNNNNNAENNTNV